MNFKKLNSTNNFIIATMYYQFSQFFLPVHMVEFGNGNFNMW